MAVVRDGVPNLWVAGLLQAGRDDRQSAAPDTPASSRRGGVRGAPPDGTLTQRTFERDGGSYPAWSPDGRWIAYQCAEGTDTHVCVTSAAAGGRLQLTDEPGQSWIGGWAPDNDTIVFAARRRGIWNIATVSRSTTAVRTLTRFGDSRSYVRYPRWDASRSRVVFERSETAGRLWAVEIGG